MAGVTLRRASRGLVLVGLALALGATGPRGAAAEPVVDTGLVVAKDLDRRTVTVTPTAVLQVERSTRILDAEGGLLPLEALAVARRVGSSVEADGDAMVRYRAERRGGRLVAETIRVLGAIPR